MFVDDLYYVMLVGGLQYDVLQVRFIFCFVINVVDVGVNVIDVIGIVKLKYLYKILIIIVLDIIMFNSVIEENYRKRI